MPVERPARFTSGEVRQALGLPVRADPPGRGRSQAGRSYTSVCTDSRALEPGALFFALSGQHRDGADFLREAAQRGALGAVVRPGSEIPELDLDWFPTPDPRRALGQLAAWYRTRSAARVVAITGSSGKTTVKEMVDLTLRRTHSVHRTAGNLNSLVGLPLTILQAPEEANLWVLELGSSVRGEIARLTEIASPNDAVVTTAGSAHLESFGSEEGVLREKLALIEGMRAGGVVVVGERPLALVREARSLRPDTIVAGLEAPADFRPETYGLESNRVWFERDGVRYHVPAGGEHHLRDALIAAATAEALGVSPDEVVAGLEAFQPLGMRSSLRTFGDLTVLVDCYNANPESFAAAIDYLTTAFSGRRLAAVVGTMLELGEQEERAHLEVAERLLGEGFALVAATGAFEKAVRDVGGSHNGTHCLSARDPEGLWDALADALVGDEVLLVKASRGVRLERIVEHLEARFSAKEGQG